jgi:ABC-type transporter lipoprotein component MlaA
MEVNLVSHAFFLCTQCDIILRNIIGSVQTNLTDKEYFIESNLDLQYGMALVTALQDITLYQAGDTIQSQSFDSYWQPNYAYARYRLRRILRQLARCS